MRPLITKLSRRFFKDAALESAYQAGKILMNFYNQSLTDPTCLNVTIKQDGTHASPVTTADHAAHCFLMRFLKTHAPGIPVISEENKNHPAIPGNGTFWCVDPLDGTKEFLARTGAFTVNISLLENFKPSISVIHNPALETTFFTWGAEPSFRMNPDGGIVEIKSRKAFPSLTALFNARHGDPSVYAIARHRLDTLGLNVPETPLGAPGLPRMLQVAQGDHDIFVDSGHSAQLKGGNGYGWDYCGMIHILEKAGGMTVEIASGRRPDFTRPTERMNAMISLGDRELGKKIFPLWEYRCQ